MFLHRTLILAPVFLVAISSILFLLFLLFTYTVLLMIIIAIGLIRLSLLLGALDADSRAFPGVETCFSDLALCFGPGCIVVAAVIIFTGADFVSI